MAQPGPSAYGRPGYSSYGGYQPQGPPPQQHEPAKYYPPNPQG
jgi:hypothetical protein